jgi:hypothetical protein
VGYLCGVAVQSYSLDSISSHAAVDFDPDVFTQTLNVPDTQTSPNNRSINSLGTLVMVAMAGVVAETLRFGDSKGGGQDLVIARGVLQSNNIPLSQCMGYLRWSVGKSLTLLRLNRNALDELAWAIEEGKDILDCYRIIEDTKE